MGGEKPTRPPNSWPSMGSPPRGRGKGGCCSGVHWRHGITPAWVGKSRCSSAKGKAVQQDHPRMGGEKSFVFLVLFLLEGSPPHGRGKVCVATHFAAYSGITPAWAGKRSARLLWRLTIGDHPRMGEEKC